MLGDILPSAGSKNGQCGVTYRLLLAQRTVDAGRQVGACWVVSSRHAGVFACPMTLIMTECRPSIRARPCLKTHGTGQAKQGSPLAPREEQSVRQAERGGKPWCTRAGGGLLLISTERDGHFAGAHLNPDPNAPRRILSLPIAIFSAGPDGDPATWHDPIPHGHGRMP